MVGLQNEGRPEVLRSLLVVSRLHCRKKNVAGECCIHYVVLCEPLSALGSQKLAFRLPSHVQTKSRHRVGNLQVCE